MGDNGGQVLSFADVNKIWMDGEFVDVDDAKVHVLTHALHYGSAVFEGIRCYDTEIGACVFRLKEHIKRLYASARPYRLSIPYSSEEFEKSILETIKINDLRACYIRPLIYFGFGQLGLYPLNCPTKTLIAVWPMGPYLGEEGLKNGIRCMISSWTKIHPNMVPVSLKASGQYINSILANLNAKDNGFDEAIFMDVNGNVSEGLGENIFLVKDGTIFTPGIESSILPGITRDAVIKVARDLGYEVKERIVSKSELFTADEVFFTGTAAEVTPVAEIDHLKVGNGMRGEITGEVQQKFFDILNGKDERYQSWFTKVYE